MPISEKQVERRKSYIGASDVPKILGLSPFGTMADVILEKQGKLTPKPANPAMAAGNRFEDGVLDQAQEELGKIIRKQFRVAKQLDFPLGANCDALLVATNEPVEAKVVGMFGPLTEPWGEPGSDEAPDQYIVQVQAEMICTAAEVGHLMAFIGGRGFCRYTIRRNIDLQEMIIEQGALAWRHVLAGTLPESSSPTLEVAKRIVRIPKKTISIPTGIVAAWDEARRQRLAAEKVEDAAEAALLGALSDAEAGQCDLGTVTYMEQKGQRRCDLDLLRDTYPEFYTAHVSQSVSRRLNLKSKK